MKTLVIHPDDRSTDFLAPIYENIDVTLLTGGVSKNDVLKMMKEHDRIIMMGHGSPWGLVSIGQFTDTNVYIVDNEMVHVLSQKKNNIFIWCNADQFVKRHDLRGFYSGMFISEVSEASYCGLPGTPQEVVTESNNAFATILGSVIDKSLKEIYYDTKHQYEMLINNPIVKYNYERLYLK